MEKFLASDCDIISQLCELGIYDYIIVGSGIGGGILSEDLARRKKKVLLIERGGSAFSTHLCNTARPDFARGRNDSAEGNEIVYNNIKSWVQTAEDSEPYVGGPMYCLGGRSIVWGLWIPRTDDKTLKDHFHPDVAEELKDTWFDEAFNLMTNNSQKDGAYPKGYISAQELDAAIEDLSDAIRDNIALGHMVALGPIATQLNSPAPYRFPQGAYSTVVPLLNRIYARDEYLSVLMDAEVIHLEIEEPSDSANYRSVKSLTIRMKSTQRTLQISTGRAKVILSAGTIGTASIALNSGLQLYKGLDLVGKGIIDHAIYLGRFARRSRFATSKDPINLQCLINICGTIALLTVTVNANFFLAGSSVLPIQQYLDPEGNEVSVEEGRLFKPETSDTIGILLEFGAKLHDKNKVLNIPSASPTIRIRRQETHNDESDQVEMQKLATRIRDKVITDILPYQWRHRKGPILPPSQDSFPPPYYSPTQLEDSGLPPLPIPFPLPSKPNVLAPRLTLLGSGIFAHEVGTMRMDGADGSHGVVDKNLQVKGFNNLHVCDLSVLPCSPPANPTLTLSALSLRLAKHLST